MTDEPDSAGSRPGNRDAAAATAQPVAPPSLDALLDRWEAAWCGRDASAFAPLCDSTIQYEDPLTPQPLIGVDELAAHAELLWHGFPDVRVERAGERLADPTGRFVAAPCKLAGTHRGSLEGLPATRRFVVVHGVVWCELRAGRLLRVRAFFDRYDAAVQLGVLPASGTLGEKALLALRGFGVRARRS
ncbi:MAG TPA: ester cyclase [Conexibacter sp.]|nr:ester cyclase [Conexibacter sp.]